MTNDSDMFNYNEPKMKMNSTTMTNGYPHPFSSPRKFETAKTLKLKRRRNIAITDGIVSPWLLCTPVASPKTDGRSGTAPSY